MVNSYSIGNPSIISINQRIALGSAQFGLPYGISNNEGQTSISEVEGILKLCWKRGINLIDTASLYGNSEKNLGKTMGGHNWKIVTKTPKIDEKKINNKHASLLIKTLRQSLFHLQRDNIYGLLIHDCNDLFKTGGSLLFNAMKSMKTEGLINKIGVSVYNPNQLKKILQNYCFDIVQLPINLFDQRFLESGMLTKLREVNIEIHVRSVFLQGLLLMESNNIPDYFLPIMPKFRELDCFLNESNIDRVNFLLSFVLGIKNVDYIIVGVNSLAQMKDLTEKPLVQIAKNVDYKKFAIQDEKFINPSNWKQL